jgi:hypothetical protein
MSRLISKATGNWLDATTWYLVDSTSFLDAETSSDTLTNTYSQTRTSAFTPGAITIDGIAVKLRSRAASPSGTMSIHLILSSDNSEVSGTEVVVNISDLPAGDATYTNCGWVFFKFSAPVSLAAATAYKIEAKSSAVSQIDLFRDATTDNFSRMLRVTTEQAPAAGDVMHVMGELTGAGTGNSFTVTMNETATTDYGPGTTGIAALTINQRGTLSYGSSAATNYYLKLSGDLVAYSGATLNIGTTGSPIPRDSTAVLEFDCASDGQFGLLCKNLSTITTQGLSRSSGKNIVSCLLNTDEAVNSTSLGVDTDTGWLDNDVIAIASTTQTSTQSEKGLLNGNATATTLTVDGFAGAGGGLVAAHSGTSPTQAEVILLTRNVKIRSASSTSMTYVYVGPTCAVDADWTEFQYVGTASGGKYGLNIVATTSIVSFRYCSVYDTESTVVYLGGLVAGGGSTEFSYNTIFTSTASTLLTIIPAATSLVSLTVDHNIIIADDNTSSPINIGNCFITFTNNTLVGGQSGLSISGNYKSGVMSGNLIHSSGSYGLLITGLKSANIGDWTIWRCGAAGLYVGANALTLDVIIDTLTIFGCGTRNILFYGQAVNYPNIIDGLVINSLVSNGDSSFATTSGIDIDGNVYVDLKINSGDFSTASGIKTAHTNDIKFLSAGNYSLVKIILNNCKLAAGTEILNIGGMTSESFIKSQKHDQTTGTHKTWKKYGVIETDSAVNMYRTAAPSMRMTPNNATFKLESGSFKVNVNSGQTCTPSVYIRESLVGDGTDYNGSRARLILKRNDAIGIIADAVIDTATNTSEGDFEQLTGTTAAATDDGVMEFIIDCDGTTGWINIDDFTATVT